MITLNDMIRSVTALFIKENPNIIYVKGIRVFFEWNDDLDTWVVIVKSKIQEKIEVISNVLIKEAIDTGNVDAIKMAIEFTETATINKILSIIREKKVEPVGILNKTPAAKKSPGYDGGEAYILDRKKPRKTKAELQKIKEEEQGATKVEEEVLIRISE